MPTTSTGVWGDATPVRNKWRLSVTTKKFNDYDLPQPNWRKDLEFGHRGENLISDFLDDVSSGSFEVKSDRYRNGRMVVETQQDPGARGTWVNSGINVTKAKWWVYQYALDGAFHVIAVDRLKRYLRLNTDKFNESTKRTFASGSENPAKGFLVFPADVLDMLTNEKYDA
jgi:hypothetical protein